MKRLTGSATGVRPDESDLPLATVLLPGGVGVTSRSPSIYPGLAARQSLIRPSPTHDAPRGAGACRHGFCFLQAPVFVGSHTFCSQ